MVLYTTNGCVVDVRPAASGWPEIGTSVLLRYPSGREASGTIRSLVDRHMTVEMHSDGNGSASNGDGHARLYFNFADCPDVA